MSHDLTSLLDVFGVVVAGLCIGPKPAVRHEDKVWVGDAAGHHPRTRHGIFGAFFASLQIRKWNDWK